METQKTSKIQSLLLGSKGRILSKEERGTITFSGTLCIAEQERENPFPAEMLVFIEGDLVLRDCDIGLISNIKKITGNLILQNSRVRMFCGLDKIGKNLVLQGAEVVHMTNLRFVGQNVLLDNSKIMWLGKLESVGGSLKMLDSAICNAKSLSLPQAKIKLKGSSIDVLGAPQTEPEIER